MSKDRARRNTRKTDASCVRMMESSDTTGSLILQGVSFAAGPAERG